MDSRILIISRNAWNNNNSTGNTASNIFSNLNESNFANLFCRAEEPNNEICNYYYRITESDLIKNFLKRKRIGTIATHEELTKSYTKSYYQEIATEKRIYDYFRNNRFHILLWGRELLWSIGGWKNPNFKTFLKEFNPNIIYMPIHDCFYMHNILRYVKRFTNAKVVLFTGDDMYSYKQFSLSPLFWINRFLLRIWISRSIKMADICYSMSDIQIKELKKQFGDKFKILRKGVRYEEISQKDAIHHDGILDFVYTGNITKGRWETLAIIGEILRELNTEKTIARLYIYSTNTLTKKMKKKLNVGDHIKFMGAVEQREIPEIQQNSDVVLHVESFKLKYKLETRLSFSTKLVDYFQNRKCILAVGWEKANSIDYLMKNDAAIVATDYKMLKEKIMFLIENKNIINVYEQKSKECGHLNHQKKDIQERLLSDFEHLVKEKGK